jgi:ABC-type sulfate transport system substrate-binding protein
MSWAYLEDSAIREVHYFLPKNWRNISNFDTMSRDELEAHSWYEIMDVVIDFDSHTQEIYDYTLEVTEAGVVRLPLIRDIVVPPPLDTVEESNDITGEESQDTPPLEESNDITGEDFSINNEEIITDLEQHAGL